MVQTGKLWLVGTPIGNLEDITLRAVKTLALADLILAEDTRSALRLMSSLEIKPKKVLSFNMHNRAQRIGYVLDRLKGGAAVALVSDAGMPVVSDPGATLVRTCREEDISVDVVPGPSAVTTAIALSGFPGTHFSFLGFLPRGKLRRRIFRKIALGAYENGVIIFFESPYRLKETLVDLLEIVGDRDLFLAREMTKLFQESIAGKVSRVIEHFASSEPKGEITVVLSGKGPEDA